MMNNKLIDSVSLAVVVAVALIALGSFVLSFEALNDLAITNGKPAHLAWIWPVIVDVALVVFTAVLLAFQLIGVRRRWLIGLILAYGVITITGNVLHAPPNSVAWFVAALPPVTLLVASEVLRELVKVRIERSGLVTTLAEMTARVDQARTEIDHLNDQIGQRREALARVSDQVKEAKVGEHHQMATQMTGLDQANEARDLAIEQRREQVMVLHEQGMNQTEMADALDVSRATIRRDLRALNGKVRG
jgi:hypothetical protein